MRPRKTSIWLASALLGLAAVAASSTASAQDAAAQVSSTGFALQRFNPAFSGDRFFGVSSPYASGDPGFHASLIFDYASNPFLISRVRGVTEPTGVVTEQGVFHVNATFAVLDRVAFNIEIPSVVVNNGNDPTFRGVTYSSPHNPAFADVRLGLRARLFGNQNDVFQLGLQGFMWVPTGARSDFTGDGEVRGMPQLLLGGQTNRIIWSFTAGPHIRPSTTINNVELGSTMEMGAGVAVRLGDERRFQVGPEMTVGFAFENQKRRNTHAELMLGAKYRITDSIEAGVAAGPGVTPGYGTPDVRFVGQISYTPDRYPPPAPPVDTDKDGVTDDKDQCPNKAQGDTPDPKKPGCPAPPDKDKDGIADEADACMDVPGVENADPSKNGCPGDSDGDGVLDKDDKCPDKAQGDHPDPKMPGCPAPPDQDGDGIFDSEDACPAIKGLPNANKAENGCPGDSDGDTIRDDLDACPEIRGFKDQDPKKNGCPKIVRFIGSEIVILQQVQFATGTAKLTGNSDEILTEVANVLKERAEILKLEVQGHTDNKGNKATNKTLSQSRSESVLKALVGKGVAADRLSAKGYGQEVPIADNATEEGRAKNRRVQFKILEKRGK
ncbi:MAG: OmpA family protein [Polyangiaceae bacterium]|nr:OmpA family protein [Polyangiaceae bacterium]